MKKNVFWALGFASWLLLQASLASASDGRSQALMYNLAFEDQTDVFLFPNLLPRYSGVYFHLPGAISGAFGGVILGWNDQALGVFVHRPLVSAFDQYRMAVTDGTPGTVGLLGGNGGAAAETHLPGQIFDIMYGNGSFGLDLRIHGWSEVSEQQGVLADPAESNSAITADVIAGFKVGTASSLRVDVGYREVKETGSLGRFAFGFRYLEPGSLAVKTVMTGELQMGLFIPEAGYSSFGLAMPFKAGVNFSVLENALVIGLLGGLDLQVLHLGDSDVKIGLAVPTIEIAAEWTALSWLKVRSAIKGGYGIQFAGDAAENTPKFEQMAFSSGLGFLFGPFRADAVLQYGVWQNGPYFLGGQNGLFAGVSVAYVWGTEAPSLAKPPEAQPIKPLETEPAKSQAAPAASAATGEAGATANPSNDKKEP